MSIVIPDTRLKMTVPDWEDLRTKIGKLRVISIQYEDGTVINKSNEDDIGTINYIENYNAGINEMKIIYGQKGYWWRCSKDCEYFYNSGHIVVQVPIAAEIGWLSIHLGGKKSLVDKIVEQVNKA
jgi:hypothetical protein